MRQLFIWSTNGSDDPGLGQRDDRNSTRRFHAQLVHGLHCDLGACSKMLIAERSGDLASDPLGVAEDARLLYSYRKRDEIRVVPPIQLVTQCAIHDTRWLPLSYAPGIPMACAIAASWCPPRLGEGLGKEVLRTQVCWRAWVPRSAPAPAAERGSQRRDSLRYRLPPRHSMRSW